MKTRELSRTTIEGAISMVLFFVLPLIIQDFHRIFLHHREHVLFSNGNTGSQILVSSQCLICNFEFCINNSADSKSETTLIVRSVVPVTVMLFEQLLKFEGQFRQWRAPPIEF